MSLFLASTRYSGGGRRGGSAAESLLRIRVIGGSSSEPPLEPAQRPFDEASSKQRAGAGFCDGRAIESYRRLPICRAEIITSPSSEQRSGSWQSSGELAMKLVDLVGS